MWEENFGTQAGVHLIEGVRLIWGPLNTGFTVYECSRAGCLFSCFSVKTTEMWENFQGVSKADGLNSKISPQS